MYRVILTSTIIGFFATLFMTRKWIGKATQHGLLGFDMNKPSRPLVAEMGGIAVVFGFLMGLLYYIGISTFYFHSTDYNVILACTCTILIMTIIGMMDDVLGWKKGISQWKKPILTIPAAMPIMVINAGQSSMDLWFIGNVDWGIIYPLVIIPIGIMGASNAYNMLAGYNGLEAGMGVIILSTLGYIAYLGNETETVVLAICMVGALVAFLWFNWYPARVFPGDTLTYSVGALVACIAIIGNMEKIATILFVPYFLDFLLVLRSRFKAEAFGKVRLDGSLDKPYDEIYHMTHLAIFVLNKVKRNVYEREVVFFIYGVELIFVGLVWAIYL
jgi:UDP-N-acetylglucosamine--dolichyl-phosphate N-acetylglucosaminephosphotransferase